MSDITPSLRILIIEDNKDFAEILCSLLELKGYNAVIAGDGIEGLDKAMKDKPDVILCDIGLPGMNGYEVVKNIRKDSALKEVPVIAMTGYAEERDLKMTKESGFTLHLAKPVDISQLIKIITQIS